MKRNSNGSFIITGELFKNFIVVNTPVDPTVISRKFGLFKLIIYNSDEYFVSFKTWETRVGDYFSIVDYSNITNGLGLFASRSYAIRDSLKLDHYSVDWLTSDQRLKDLKFSSW
ncbi:hypothetical protein ACFLSY_08560 [Bacteroidota bacterium]